MEYIGSVPTKLWEKAQAIATAKEYPVAQTPDCPYIILVKFSQDQLLALAGYFSKQHIDLNIIEVCSPGCTPKTRVSIPQLDWNKAHNYAQELLARAFSHASSTTEREDSSGK